MPTYLVETILRPGVMYEVSAEEYERLRDGNWLVGDPDRITPEVLDQELAAVVEDTQSQTRAAVQAIVSVGGVPDADADTKGVIILAGDLGGTATAPTVPALDDKQNVASLDADTAALVEDPSTAAGVAVTATAASVVAARVPTPASSAVTAPAVGRPVIVADNGTYNGLGGIARTADGTLVATWRSGTNHGGPGQPDDGVIKFSTSTSGGQTWDTPATALAVPSVDLRDPAPCVTQDGTWLVAYFRYAAGIAQGVRVLRSTDDGANWTDHTTPSPYSGSNYACSMNPVQLPDGTLLIACYGHTTGFWTVRLLRSTDDGATWSVGATVADGLADSASYQEPTLTILGDGRLLCLIRTDSTTITKAYSADGGLTWGAVTDAISDANGRPAAYESAGALVCVYRQLDVNGALAAYRVSLDHGGTWSQEWVLANSYGPSQYASLAETSRGVLGVLLGTEGAASTIARVHFRYMIVAPQASPIGDQGAHGSAVAVAARLSRLRAYDTLDRPDRAVLNGDFSDSGHEYVAVEGSQQILDGEIAHASGTVGVTSVLARGAANGRFRVPVKWAAGITLGIGVVFRLIDSSNHLFVNIEGGGTTIKLYKKDGGAFVTLVTATTPPVLRGGYWHDVEIDFKGDRIKVYIEGDKVIDYTMTAGELTKYGTAYRHGFRSGDASHRFGPWSLTA